MSKKTIKNKIIWNIFLTIILSSFVIALIIGYISYGRSMDSKNKELISFNKSLTDKTDIFLNEVSLTVKKISSNQEIINWLVSPSSETAAINQLLDNFNIGDHYSAIYLMNTQGNTLASTDLAFIGENYSFRKYFQEALTGEIGTETAIGITSNLPGLYFSSPVHNQNSEIIGVIVMKIDFKALDEILNITQYPGPGHIMITDENGIIIQSDRPERIFKSLGAIDFETLTEIKKKQLFGNLDIASLPYDPAYSLIKGGLTETQNVSFYEIEDKEREIITISPLKTLPLFIVSENNLEELISDAILFSLFLFLTIILISILSIFWLLFFIKKLLKPIETLKKMATEIGHGNFQIKESVKSNDELEDLSKVLINVSRELETYYKDMEKKVVARTKELTEEKRQAESAKKAIVNILEDVENEKNKVSILASDLEKFKLALDNTTEYAIITDPEGRIIYANQGMEKNTGYKIKEVIGKTANELWRLPMSDKQIKEIWNKLQIEKKPYVGELKNKKKNGELFDSYVTISPVLNAKKELSFLVSLARDITKEKEIDRAKTEFVSLASHQLRTPLSSINWYSEMLIAGDAGKLNKEQQDFIGEIYKGSQRMVDLVNSLLDVSRLELGTFSIEPSLLDLDDPAKSIINELQPLIKAKEMTVSFASPKNHPLISVDPKLTRIIFQNFISNSIKYTPEKGKIKIEIIYDDKNATIKVTDNGYGIPSRQTEKIFDKLFRADNIKEKDTEGTGLGLYIVKSIADNSGSKVWFESEENKGTSFFFSIPLSGMKKKDGTKTLNS